MISFGKLIFGVFVLGAGVVATRKQTVIEPGPDPDPNVQPPDQAFELVEAYLNGAELGQVLPLIIVLHAEGSTPEAAIDIIRPITGAARVVAPRGRYTLAGGRFFVDPALAGDAYWTALRQELGRLGDVLEAVTTESPMPAPGRAMVVGFGAGGALAVGLGLQMPLRVRQAWGTGGAVPPSWVLLSMPQLKNMQRPQLRKITFGSAIKIDNETAKLAQSRGADMSLMQLGAPPEVETVQKWILGDLDMFLLTP